MTELAASASVRALNRLDSADLLKLLDRDPIANVFVRHRLEYSRHDQRWLGAQMWGYFKSGELVSACHVGTNTVPIEATEGAVAAFAARLRDFDAHSRSIVGPADAVRSLSELLLESWGTPRSQRLDQPLLAIDTDSHVAPDPRVRAVTIAELDALYPACVRMFTEEVGVRPDIADAGAYRARVAQLIARGWAFAIIDRNDVVFKAEVGAASAGV